MAFNTASGSSQSYPSRSQHYSSPTRRSTESEQPKFDIIDWYPHFQSCQRYFLDVAQHSGPVQALAAFLNIQLPFQRNPAVMSSSGNSATHGRQHLSPIAQGVSLIPYIRRLVATGHDLPNILHGFFGDNWSSGVGALHEVERRNYLFAAKSTSWVKVKQSYDMNAAETVPFLAPLKEASEKEIQSAESKWSEWLAMQDWMLGPRSPEMARVKRESAD